MTSKKKIIVPPILETGMLYDDCIKELARALKELIEEHNKDVQA